MAKKSASARVFNNLILARTALQIVSGRLISGALGSDIELEHKPFDGGRKLVITRFPADSVIMVHTYEDGCDLHVSPTSAGPFYMNMEGTVEHEDGVTTITTEDGETLEIAQGGVEVMSSAASDEDGGSSSKKKKTSAKSTKKAPAKKSSKKDDDDDSDDDDDNDNNNDNDNEEDDEPKKKKAPAKKAPAKKSSSKTAAKPAAKKKTGSKGKWK